MAESILFSFTKIDDFMELMIDDDNITTSLFDGVTNNFKIVLAEACPDNIEQCLNSDYTLNDSVSIITGTNSYDGACALLWSKGVNANRSISIANSSITYDLADNSYMLKGAFLCTSQGKVLAYSINNASITVSEQIIMPIDGMVWSIYSQISE